MVLSDNARMLHKKRERPSHETMIHSYVDCGGCGEYEKRHHSSITLYHVNLEAICRGIYLSGVCAGSVFGLWLERVIFLYCG